MPNEPWYGYHQSYHLVEVMRFGGQVEVLVRKQELDTMVSEGKSCLHSESFANQFWSVAMIVKMLRLNVITESYPGRHPIIQSILN